MATTRAHVEAALSVHDPDALRMILEASQVPARGAGTPAELASRVADALWWNYCTPLGYVAERATLEDIVAHVARKLRVPDSIEAADPVWDQLRSLTRELVRQVQPGLGVRLDDLDPKARNYVWPDWMPTVAYGSGASGSFAARWTSGKVLALLRSPIGRLLPLIPPLAPWIGAIKTGAGAVYVVAGPLGVALSVLTVNQALGSNYHRLVPLLLGVGALGPDAVDDAVVVEAGA